MLVSKSLQLAPGTRVVKVAVPRRAKAGAYTLRQRLRDVAAGTVTTVNCSLRVPRA